MFINEFGVVRNEFQSPMGIGITSNNICAGSLARAHMVSIPNGDRHYLEHALGYYPRVSKVVSIPNGDRHYLERIYRSGTEENLGFQSPMGIGITSNRWRCWICHITSWFQSPMGIGITSNAWLCIAAS